MQQSLDLSNIKVIAESYIPGVFAEPKNNYRSGKFDFPDLFIFTSVNKVRIQFALICQGNRPCPKTP
jgi:hypothetical protein